MKDPHDWYDFSETSARDRAPVYHGRSLEEWNAMLAGGTTRDKHREALRSLGFGTEEVPVPDEALPMILALVESGEFATRCRCLGMLSKLKNPGDQVLDTVLAVIREDKGGNAYRAGFVLGHFPDRADYTVPRLIDMLEKRGESASAAASALGRIGPAARDGVPALEASRSGADEKLSGEIEKALNSIRSGDHTPAAEETEDSRARLFEPGPEKARVSEERDEEVAPEKTHDGQGAKASAAPDSNPPDSGGIGRSQPKPIAYHGHSFEEWDNLLADGRVHNENREAFTALGYGRNVELVPPEAVPMLLALVEHGQPAARYRSLRILEGLENPGDNVLDVVIKVLSDEASDGNRARAGQLLARFPGHADFIVPRLTELLHRADQVARESAIRALGHIGPAATNALPALKTLRSGTDEHLTKVINQTLAAIEGKPVADATAKTITTLDDLHQHIQSLVARRSAINRAELKFTLNYTDRNRGDHDRRYHWKLDHDKFRSDRSDLPFVPGQTFLETLIYSDQHQIRHIHTENDFDYVTAENRGTNPVIDLRNAGLVNWTFESIDTNDPMRELAPLTARNWTFTEPDKHTIEARCDYGNRRGTGTHLVRYDRRYGLHPVFIEDRWTGKERPGESFTTCLEVEPKSFGDGLWFPAKTTWYRIDKAGKEEFREVMTLESAVFNQPVNPGHFTVEAAKSFAGGPGVAQGEIKQSMKSNDTGKPREIDEIEYGTDGQRFEVREIVYRDPDILTFQIREPDRTTPKKKIVKMPWIPVEIRFDKPDSAAVTWHNLDGPDTEREERHSLYKRGDEWMLAKIGDLFVFHCAIKWKKPTTALPGKTAPVKAWFQAVKSSDIELLKTVFSERYRGPVPEGMEEEEYWVNRLKTYTDLWKKEFGDFELADFAFVFQGDETAGTVSVFYQGKMLPGVLVIKEGDQWKVNEL